MAFVGKLVQESILLIILEVQELGDAQEVGRLKEGKEGVQEGRLVVNVNLIDADQVLQNLVTCRVKSMRRQEL